MQAGCEARRGKPPRWPWMNWPERYSQKGTYSKEVIVGALNTLPVPRSHKENESRPAHLATRHAAEAKERIARELTLPSGSWLSWDGQFENLMAAWQRLAFVVPGCFLLIFLLL
jgi:hypothetical protein